MTRKLITRTGGKHLNFKWLHGEGEFGAIQFQWGKWKSTKQIQLIRQFPVKQMINILTKCYVILMNKSLEERV